METARNIGGVSFKGDTDINLPGVNMANQNTSGTAAGLSSTLAIAKGGTGATSASGAATAFGLGDFVDKTFIDEDDFSSNSAAAVPSQQSVKAYVDSVFSGLDVKKSVRTCTTAKYNFIWNTNY